MARPSKLPRYKEFNKAKNAFGHRAHDPKTWNKYLDPSKPLTLELGCGKAEVSLGLAKLYPDQNFIGVDLKADRLWRASQDALGAKLSNAAFIQADILELKDFFKPGSIENIWLTFPDPFPKKRQAKHRMLNHNFLEVYKFLLMPGGEVHFKTDNPKLFDWAAELLAEAKGVSINVKTDDLHGSSLPDDLKIITTYEKRFIEQGLPIRYLSFSFK